MILLSNIKLYGRIDMKIDIGEHEFSIIWDGVFYCALSDYPNISKW